MREFCLLHDDGNYAYRLPMTSRFDILSSVTNWENARMQWFATMDGTSSIPSQWTKACALPVAMSSEGYRDPNVTIISGLIDVDFTVEYINM